MTDSKRWAFDSRMPLKCCEFPALERKIGVLASQPFHHHGLGAEFVDISRETISVTTKTYGRCYPSGSATGEIRRAAQHTIDDLDAVIAELTAHRDRLRATLIPASIEGGSSA